MRSAKAHIIISLVVIGILVMAMSAVGCGDSEPADTTPESSPTPVEKTYELRLQHRWSAGENFFFEYFADLVNEMSGGRIEVEIFADGELMAGDDVPDALKSGVLDMAFFHPGNFMGTVPVGTIETIPFLWKNLDEFIAIHYAMGLEDVYREAFMDEYGIYMVGITPNDYGIAMWTDEFSSLADLNGRKARLSGSLANILEPYGVSSVSMPGGDIYTSLATGVIDGVSYGGIAVNNMLGFTEYTKYIMLPYEVTSHSPAYWINADLWDELPDDLKSILEQAVYGAGLYMRYTYAAGEAEAIEEALAQGCELVQLSAADVNALTEGALVILEELKGEDAYAAQGGEIIEEALREWGYID